MNIKKIQWEKTTDGIVAVGLEWKIDELLVSSYSILGINKVNISHKNGEFGGCQKINDMWFKSPMKRGSF